MRAWRILPDERKARGIYLWVRADCENVGDKIKLEARKDEVTVVEANLSLTVPLCITLGPGHTDACSIERGKCFCQC